MQEVTTVYKMTFDGGDVCLDFINSGYDREAGVITERLHSYGNLLTLVERLGLFDQAVLSYLSELALTNEAEAATALDTTRKLRGLLYQLFESITQQTTGKLEDHVVSELNRAFQQALQFKVLSLGPGDVQFNFDAKAAALMAPVWRFVLSAYELLNDDEVRLIRQCARCAWLFVDKTKNHRKKWCSMASCGNRQKTQRYYLTQKKN